jgi:hypothetical protein
VARKYRKPIRLLAAFAVCVTFIAAASARVVSSKQQNLVDSNESTAERREARQTEPLQEAFRSVSLRLHPLVILSIEELLERSCEQCPDLHYARYSVTNYYVRQARTLCQGMLLEAK